MPRFLGFTILICLYASQLIGCGQTGPLVLPEDAHDEPSTQEPVIEQ